MLEIVVVVPSFSFSGGGGPDCDSLMQEEIDAPQWVDFTVEAALEETVG